jgi:hypothetical protein
MKRLGGRSRLVAIQLVLIAAASLFAASIAFAPLEHSPTPEKHQIETMPGGVALLDFDNDGRLDIFLTNGAAQPSLQKSGPKFWNRLYRQLPNGQFADVTQQTGVAGEGYSMGVAAADYDQDGWTDLFVTGVGRNLLYRNVNGQRFEQIPFAATGWSISAGWFDYDRDGDLDLFVVNYVRYDRAREPFCGDARAGYRTYCHPRYYEPVPNALFRNDNGTFTDVSSASGIGGSPGKGMAVAFADYDGDGFLDVLVTNDTEPNFLFRNRGDGTFVESGMAAGIGLNDDGRALSSMGADFRDLNNDGQPDIFVTALVNETFPLFINLGRGLFADRTYPLRLGVETIAYSGWSAGAFDFDNDGRKDLFCANGDVNDNAERYSGRASRQRNLLLWQQPDGTFRGEPIGEPARYRGAAFGDLDGDGAVDAVVTRLGERPWIWRNPAPRKRNWLRVRAPLGAQVIVRARIGGRDIVQSNIVTQAVGYASSSEPVAHFGLGDAATAAEVTVRKLTGETIRLENQPAGRVIDAESRGPRAVSPPQAERQSPAPGEVKIPPR